MQRKPKKEKRNGSNNAITHNIDTPVMLLDLIHQPKETRAIQDRPTIRMKGIQMALSGKNFILKNNYKSN
jgi:hypothetical protein